MNNNLLKLFIEGILNIQCQDIKVLNPDLSRNHVEDKDIINVNIILYKNDHL